MVNWKIGSETLEPEVKKEEDKLFGEIDFIEKEASILLKQDLKNAKDGRETRLCREYLTNYSNTAARSVIDKWWELGDDLWVKMRWKF